MEYGPSWTFYESLETKMNIGPTENKWDQYGPKRDLKGPNETKRDQKGPKGPKGTKRDQIRL